MRLFIKILIFFQLILISQNTYSESIEDYVALEFGDNIPIESTIPFSDLIECLKIATNKNGEAIMGIAYKKIQSYKLITGIVVVKKEKDAFILLKADFPDINKIKNGKNRRKVASILEPITNITFIPNAKKRVVDLTSGATRYGAESLNYFNYLLLPLETELFYSYLTFK